MLGSSIAEKEVCRVFSPTGLCAPKENPHAEELRKRDGTRCAAVK